jgi:ABC-type cobalt transport system substrate-binding protein
MKRTLIAILILIALCAFFFSLWIRADAEWSGVDRSIVEKFAKEAGRPPSEPLVNTERGDLLLFLFLLAGTVGGFVGGVYFRQLFPTKPGANNGQPDV